jgi:hypothetical protein
MQEAGQQWAFDINGGPDTISVILDNLHLALKLTVHAESFVHYSILELYMVKELQHDVCVKIDAAMPTKTHLFDSILPWCNVTCLP